MMQTDRTIDISDNYHKNASMRTIDFPISLKRIGWVMAWMSLLLSGCTHVSPRTITRDRFDYGETLADSWKRQTLINIVRLRYADTPLFMDITSIINSYSQSGRLSAGAMLFPSSPSGNTFPLGAEGSWSNTPTVTYQPLGGDKFTHSLLRPVAPAAIFQMMQTGWRPDLIFRLAVRSVNSISNRGVGRFETDPRFDRMLQALDRAMQSQALGLRVEERKDGEAIVMVIRGRDAGDIDADINTLRELWGLEAGTTEINVTYGAMQRNGQDVVVMTRSMLEIMMAIALDIEVPAAHLAENRVLAGKQNVDGDTQPLIRIRSGKSAPADAYAAVPFKDHWFWIDDTDIVSKTRFTFLMILFSLAETGTPLSAPLVTVPSR